LIIFAPVFLIIAIAIKFEGKGPVFFKQERMGYKGKPFLLFKFRTMIVNAEANNVPQLYRGKNDPRLTKIGRFLRNHHLDELPQLWNVLKGEMSFVGPRPERKYFIDQILSLNHQYTLLYQLRPGLFSNATLYNGYTDSMEKMLNRLRMDLEYLTNRSFFLDLQIILLTSLSIIFGKKF
jgi:lipopolysaccharide/colanic/teichoic acid biosynthesis glycosyltransferase